MGRKREIMGFGDFSLRPAPHFPPSLRFGAASVEGREKGRKDDQSLISDRVEWRENRRKTINALGSWTAWKRGKISDGAAMGEIPARLRQNQVSPVVDTLCAAF